MRKLLGVATMALTLGVTSLFAQNTDAQIKQLEKELRLLELQKQVEQAKQGNTQSKNTQNTQQIQAKTQPSLCGGKYLGTGCFVGFELGGIFGKANITGTIGGSNDPINKTGIGGVAINALMGYQWYFMDMMGIGVKANIGYGGIIPAFSYATSGTRTASFSSSAYNALNYGVEAQYLVDFSSMFGIGIGLGFDGMNFFDSNLIDEASSGNFTGTRTYPFKGFNIIGFSASVGLRFVVKSRHILGLNYKYRVFIDKDIKSKSAIVKTSSNGTATTQSSNFTIKINPAHLLSFSYVYKF